MNRVILGRCWLISFPAPFFFLIEIGLQVRPDVMPVHECIYHDREEKEKKEQPGFTHGILEALPPAFKVSLSAFVPHSVFTVKLRFFRLPACMACRLNPFVPFPVVLVFHFFQDSQVVFVPQDAQFF